MTITTLSYRVTDEGTLAPLPRFQRQFDETFCIGTVVIMEQREERSVPSHNHLFAQISDAWGTLPPQYEGRWINPEHFRKYLLIKAGFADHQQHVCNSNAEAERLRRALAKKDVYSLVLRTGCVVDDYTAQSMSNKAMDKRRFAEAKEKILGLIDEMLGVDQGDTEKNAGNAA